VRCPKDKNTELLRCKLLDQLSAHQCPNCSGHWISGSDYQGWQASQPSKDAGPSVFWARDDVQYIPSAKDSLAALCPECGNYLTRGKVGMKPPFYVDRCPGCGGLWCDCGEWNILLKLGIHAAIPQIFSRDWQLRFRELELLELERQAIAEKLGDDLADKVFEIATLLKQHPSGDFGVAYLMRRLEKS